MVKEAEGAYALIVEGTYLVVCVGVKDRVGEA